MKIYLVGGAVRDALMGRTVQDRDWVVVGAQADELLKAGYLQVGRDFPVFLHPKTREEYALARTERKSAPGYRGFVVHASPEVTLEEDLARRDLSINAIAAEVDAQLQMQRLIDPYGGRADIAAKVLRHTTEAFREDPVRLLRLARFAARFNDFSVDAATQALLRAMVDGGEADHLVAERVWQELAQGLMEIQPSRMFAVLRDCGALQRLLPELEATAADMACLDRAAGLGLALELRYALLDKHGDAQLQQRLRVPADSAALARLLAQSRDVLQGAQALRAAALVQWLEQCDAFRKPQRFAQLLTASACESGSAPSAAWAEALRFARQVDAGAVAATVRDAGGGPLQIGEAVRQARIAAVARGLAIT